MKVLAVCSDLQTIASLEILLDGDVVPIFSETGNDILSILTELEAQAKDASHVMIDAYLLCREHPTPSDLGGAALAMHIRLTPSLEKLSLLPLVVLTHDPIAWLLRESPDYILLLAPACEVLVRTSEEVTLPYLLEQMQSFENLEEMQRAIRPFVLYTEADERMREHSYRNRAGASRFLQEFSGATADEAILLHFDTAGTAPLWLKKLYFLHPELRAVSVGDADDLGKLRRMFQARSVLVIDDEHRFGWSYGIHRALSDPPVSPEFFQNQANDFWTEDRKLRCVDSFQAAMNLLEESSDLLQERLQTWKTCEQALLDCDQKQAKANKSVTETKQKESSCKEQLTKSEEKYEKCQASFQAAEAAMLDQFEKLAPVAFDIMEEDTGSPGSPEVKQKLVMDAHTRAPQLSRIVESYKSASKSLADAEAPREQAQKDCADAQQEKQAAEEGYKQAQREYQQARTAMSSAEAQLQPLNYFPYSMVFLDLRLEHPEDEQQPIEELTGMRLLKKIKTCFPDVPVIMMTASAKALSSEKARSLGVDGYWTKGIQSGNMLRQTVLACAEKLELRAIWLNIQKIQHKTNLYCNTSGSSNVSTLPHGNSDRKLMERWLVDSFLLLQRGRDSLPLLSSQDHPYDHIILNMGLIQELRFKHVQDAFWESNTSEESFRKMRNNVAHAFRSNQQRQLQPRESCNRDDALKFFRHTLKCLLSNMNSP